MTATYTEADVQRIVQQALEQQQVVHADPVRAQLAREARVTKDNNVLDRMKVQRMTPEERRQMIVDQDIAEAATQRTWDVLAARDAVADAKRLGIKVDPDVKALAETDLEKEVNTQKIECLVENVHLGDGRKLVKGEVAKCEPSLAKLLADKGRVRLIRPGRPKKTQKAGQTENAEDGW